MSTSKYQGAYAAFYKSLPWARVLSSGQVVARRLREEGVDAVFVSKGYDERLICNMERTRDIEVAFIGSTKGDAYAARAETLRAIGAATDLLVTRTESGREYVELLNRIRIFISADVGMGEYMIKNFEAMACGCVLLTWSQGEEEDSALGFEDGQNVMLYRSAEEAVEKISMLKANPELAERIARAGQVFVEQHYTFARVGRDLARAIEQPMRPWPGVSAWQRMWVRLRYGIKV
jgi:glycosyltransferase involved in cell wall biosynthesis